MYQMHHKLFFLAKPWREQVTFGAILIMSEAGTLS